MKAHSPRAPWQRIALSLGLVFLDNLCPSSRASEDDSKQVSPPQVSRARNRPRGFERNPIPGSRAIVSILAEGSVVRSGDLVCELDSSDLRDSLENLEIEIASAEAESRRRTLLVEAAEVALKEEEAQWKADKSRLSESLKVAKAKVALLVERAKSSPSSSTSDAKAAEEAKREQAAIETEVEQFETSGERLRPFAEAVEQAKEEKAMARQQWDSLIEERRSHESKIAACRMTAKGDGRVVHARWRPRSSSPEGYAVLESGVLVVEAQPLFRISAIRTSTPGISEKSRSWKKRREARQAVPLPPDATGSKG